MNRSFPRGQSAIPILVFLGIVTLSVVFFFAFTAPQCGATPRAAKPAPAKPVPVPVQPPKPVVTAPTPPVEPPKPVTPPKPFYLKSSQFLAAVAEKLAAGKVDETFDLLAPSVSPERKALYEKLFTSGYRPVMNGAASPWKEIGRISGQERWMLPIERVADASPKAAGNGISADGTKETPAPAIAEPSQPGSGISLITGEAAKIELAGSPPILDSGEISPPEKSSASDAPSPDSSPAPATASSQLYVDLKLTREDGFRITNIRFSPDLTDKDPALADDPDALAISHDFVTELLGKNFRSARKITDETKVTHEKLAGLCIVFEEGEYAMIPGSSLNVTAANQERAWALVRVRSAKQNTDSEFGVEMSRNSQNQWKVDALDFSKLLQTYVESTEGGKVYYTPIVKNPSGGESLVVYFEYDKSDISERGLHQLEIVADLLKSDPARKMRLSGYADALGTEDYNYQLSKRRAESVQKKLAELGVPADQIVTRGFGAEAPLDPNKKEDGTDNPEGRSRNRRTEIYLDF